VLKLNYVGNVELTFYGVKIPDPHSRAPGEGRGGEGRRRWARSPVTNSLLYVPAPETIIKVSF